LQRVGTIDRVAARVDVQDLALLADDERIALGKCDQRRLDPVAADEFARGVGDERELRADLTAKRGVLGLFV
jgi:hypothetical protein